MSSKSKDNQKIIQLFSLLNDVAILINGKDLINIYIMLYLFEDVMNEELKKCYGVDGNRYIIETVDNELKEEMIKLIKSRLSVFEFEKIEDEH